MSLDRKLLSLFTAGLIGLTALSCSPAPSGRSNGSVSSGCSKDTDCKGDRVCYQGECVSPSQNFLKDVSEGKDGYLGDSYTDSSKMVEVGWVDSDNGTKNYTCAEFRTMFDQDCCPILTDCYSCEGIIFDFTGCTLSNGEKMIPGDLYTCFAKSCYSISHGGGCEQAPLKDQVQTFCDKKYW